MGRHSAPREWPFIRSLVAWLLPWLAIAFIVGLAVWVTVSTLGRPEVDPGVGAATTSRSPTPSVSPTEPGDQLAVSGSVDGDPVVPSPRREREQRDKSDQPERQKLITKGITIQVLNGTSAPDAGDAMAARLTSLGFDIVAVEPSSKAYADTTVFWSHTSARAAATALAARFGWTAAPKPANLADTVDLHVVVGADEL